MKMLMMHEAIGILWASTQENLSSVFANNKGAQPDLQLCYSILESIISKLHTSEFSIFKLVSAAEETGLSLTLLENPKTGFVATRSL